MQCLKLIYLITEQSKRYGFTPYLFYQLFYGKTKGWKKYTARTITMTLTIFIQIPAFAIVSILSKSELNTAALGGVEIGNIKAHEAASATVAIKPYGSKPIPAASPIVIGIIILEVAVLDISSVIIKTDIAKIKMIIK